jgi:hypothetical protein
LRLQLKLEAGLLERTRQVAFGSSTNHARRNGRPVSGRERR